MYAYSSSSSQSPGHSAPRVLPRRSLGDVTNTQIASTASTIGTTIGFALGGPIGGAIAAAIGAFGTLITQVFSGCGQTCVQASNLANQAGSILGQAFNTYMAAPVHTASAQQAFLQLFNQTWAQLEQACGNPALGQAGMKCISDRERGACTWTASPGGWNQDPATGAWTYTFWGAAGSGTSCWNWFNGMYDPIANDPTVVPDSNPVSLAEAGVSSLLNGTTFDWQPLLIPAALALAALWVLD